MESLQKEISFDDILNDKLGFGKFQILTLLILGFINFNDGAEQILTILMNPILEKEWNLSQFQIQILGCCFFLGMFFGNILSGYLADKIGRRNTMIYSTSLQLVTVVFTATIVQEIYFMIILRFLYGLVNGMTLPLSYVMIAEIVPQNIRGRSNICPVLFEYLGKWYTMFLGYIYMQGFRQGNWRAMAVANVIPCLIVLIGNIKILLESPRYLIIINKLQQAVNIINKIGFINKNNKYQNLQDNEIQQINNWQQQQQEQQNQTKDISIKGLFSQQNKKITICFWAIGWSMNFMLSANLFLLPFLLDYENFSMKDMAYTNSGDIFALILVYYTIDKVNIGRKNSLIFAFLSQSITMLVIYFFKVKFLVLGLLISNFLQRICFQSLNVMVTESYVTQYRSMGAGYYYGLSRLAGAASPFIMLNIFNIDPYLQFLVYFVLNVLNFLFIYIFPFDLTNKQLDQEQEKLLNV